MKLELLECDLIRSLWTFLCLLTEGSATQRFLPTEHLLEKVQCAI